MLGGADNPNGELPSYITGADIKLMSPHQTRFGAVGLNCRFSKFGNGGLLSSFTR